MLEYKIVTTIEELEPYKEIWSNILECEKNDNPFIEYEWVSTWWTVLGCKENVEIYVVEHKGDAIAFLPLVHSTRFGGIHQFGFLGQGFATYMEVISEEMWKEQAFEYMLEELTRKFQRVLFLFHGLLESKETSRALEKYAVQRQLPHSISRVVTPYIDFESVEITDFLKKHRRKFKDINRCERRLKSLGELTFQEVHARELDKMFQLFNRRWQKKIDKSGFTEGKTRMFFEKLAEQRSSAFRVEVNSLEFEGQWIGFTMDICCRGRNFCQSMGHEPDFNIFGPGRLVERENMLKTHSSNYRLYDFGSGYEPYKFEWYTHLDFTRKFVMSSSGTRERIVRQTMVIRDSIKDMLSSNHQLVKLKRDRLGETLYFLKEARLKDWVITLNNGLKRNLYLDIFDIYYLENNLREKAAHFHVVPIQKVLEHENRSEFISHYFKKYKIYSEGKKKIAFLQHDSLIREDSIGYMQELPPNATYVKDYDINILPNIVDEVQQKSGSTFTSARWYEWRKRKELGKLGFQRVERIRVHRFFKWEKVTYQNNEWAKTIQEKGRNLDQVLSIICLPLIIL